MMLIKKICAKINEQRMKSEWRKRNQHNGTQMGNEFIMDLVKVGKHTYGPLYIVMGNVSNCVNIGSYCSIANNVTFILNSDHNLKTVSTYPFATRFFHSKKYEALSKGDITIGDDVWIGHGAIILSGVTIGQGAVVAAGSVVVKDVPPYSVVAGNPAKVVKYRFENEIIERLLKIDYSTISDAFFHEHQNDFDKEIKSIEDINWLKTLKMQ